MKVTFPRPSSLDYSLIRAALRLHEASAHFGLHRRYFDLLEGIRGRLGDADLAKNAELNTIFIHIPKCGGTSIRSQLPFETGHRSIMYFFRADRALFERCFKFTVVRNPYDRLVSGFHWIRFHSRHRHVRRWAGEHLGRFESFDVFLASLRDRGFQRQILSWIMFTPQWYFVCDASGRVMVDHVGRLESLGETIEVANARANLALVNQKLWTSKRGPFQDYFPEGREDVVLEMYREDFEIFGYDTLVRGTGTETETGTEALVDTSRAEARMPRTRAL